MGSFTYRRTLLISSVAVCALAVGSGAYAQDVRQAAPSTEPFQERPATVPTLRIVHGTVAQYLMNPDGVVDGFLLADDTVVRFPEHLGEKLVQMIWPTEPATVEGYSSGPKNIQATIISNDNRRVALHDTPPPKDAPPPAGLGVASVQKMHEVGIVRVLMRTPRGEVDGIVMKDHTIIRFPSTVGTSFASTLGPGRSLAAEGFGIENPYGRCIEATALGPSLRQLKPIRLPTPSDPKAPATPSSAQTPLTSLPAR